MLTSARLGISYPDPATEADDPYITQHIKNLLDGVETSAQFSQGAASSRPTSTPGSPGMQGRYYFATDTRQLSYDYGTGWINMGGARVDLLPGASTDTVLTSQVVGDAQARLTVTGDGKLAWGDGTGAPDLSASRVNIGVAGGTLLNIDQLRVQSSSRGILWLGSGATWNSTSGNYGIVFAGSTPVQTPSGGGFLYARASDAALVYRTPLGNDRVLALP